MNVESYKNKYGRYITFIKKYSQAQNASTGSEVDSNANVDNKNVTTCTGELYKRDAIGINRLRMINKITELYGEDLAKEYIRQLDSHEIYRHDETSPMLPYTYGPQEVITVKYNNKVLLVSFDELYVLCNEPEFLVDDVNTVYCKKPENMYVVDRYGWTKVINLFKKKQHKKMVNILVNDGNASVIVTEDHPMIISEDFENTVPAKDSTGKFSLVINNSCVEFKGSKYEHTYEEETQYAAGYRLAKDSLRYYHLIDILQHIFDYSEEFAFGILDGYKSCSFRDVDLKINTLDRILKHSVSADWKYIDRAAYSDEYEYGWIYDISTESHTFVCNSLWVHNCVSITMYPYLFHGTTNIGGNSEAPKHLDSFCGSFINLVYAIAAQFAGAIATPEFLMYMDYFIRKDYGDAYYLHPERVVSFGMKEKTLENLIENKFQQVVYTINDPAGSRNFQSVE